MTIEQIKQRFGIIAKSPSLQRAIDTAMQVSSTDLTVLITGESGTGKEFFPKIIHYLSPRKHSEFVAVNCGAIPEGTVDSELFGHEKGSFTSAHEGRKGYFEVANGGTIFLDEIAELPLQTQVRLLRVLETGEFLRVGSSKVIKTNVRVVAATNVNIPNAISQGKFREDLYYRLNTVPINIPPLRERKEDILLLFRKFAADFADKYNMPPLRLNENAQNTMLNYSWKGNVRQLKNITEQMSIIEQGREISAEILQNYLPWENTNTLPMLIDNSNKNNDLLERELLYKFLFEMKHDLNDLKKLVTEIIKNSGKGLDDEFHKENADAIKKLDTSFGNIQFSKPNTNTVDKEIYYEETDKYYDEAENLSIENLEVSLIKKALKKHNNKRKKAADDLGISERTLYRKIKEYNIQQ